MSDSDKEPRRRSLNPWEMLEEARETYKNRLLRRYEERDLQDFLIAYHIMIRRYARDLRAAQSVKAQAQIHSDFQLSERELWSYINLEATGDSFYTIEQARKDAEVCTVCFTKGDLHVDHIVPKALGGTDHPDNLQILCRGCNCSKGGRTHWEWSQTKRGASRRRADGSSPV
jgi:hypothetical protein